MIGHSILKVRNWDFKSSHTNLMERMRYVGGKSNYHHIWNFIFSFLMTKEFRLQLWGYQWINKNADILLGDSYNHGYSSNDFYHWIVYWSCHASVTYFIAICFVEFVSLLFVENVWTFKHLEELFLAICICRRA